ncbi:hypothetical protein D9M68_711820 [compost metagenome]
MYFGTTSYAPTNVSDLSRVSPVKEYILNTGTSGMFFNIVIKTGVPILSVVDLDAGAFGDITSAYALNGSLMVEGVMYNHYLMELAAPYSYSHRHKIIFGSQFDKSVKCHWHLGGTKEFKNEDNTVVKQIGRIRIDADSDLPEVGQKVEVVGHFEGIVRDVYKGQLSWRIDV